MEGNFWVRHHVLAKIDPKKLDCTGVSRMPAYGWGKDLGSIAAECTVDWRIFVNKTLRIFQH